VTESWRILYEEVRNLYSSPDKIMTTKSRRRRLTDRVSRIEECLFRESNWKRILGKLRQRFDNTKMDLMKIRLEIVDWIHPPQDTDRWHTLADTVMQLRFR
jgi:hypothetical protein